uniref:Uncharacterized protein LOC114349067 n=1 Tax=Diabrotica virgifera virgifera TaxID=50390 RepID=A0A6P7HCD0_DIAVI
MKCGSKLSEAQREDIFKKYWNDTADYNIKRQFILSCVQTKPTERSRSRSGDESKLRSNTLVYSFVINGNRTVVCRTMFLNTLSISQQVVKTALSKRQDGGMVQRDLRGTHEPSNKTTETIIHSVVSHISSFPKYECHYNRERSKKNYLGPDLNIEKMYKLYEQEKTENKDATEDIAKPWLYRDIFNKQFNLTFKPPEVDTCDDCDMFSAKIRAIDNDSEKQLIENEKDTHLKEAEDRYKFKSIDMAEAKVNIKHKVLTGDLQKCLPTPYLTNCVNFYKRKLWTLNYTLYDGYNSAEYCEMWDETK